MERQEALLTNHDRTYAHVLRLSPSGRSPQLPCTMLPLHFALVLSCQQTALFEAKRQGVESTPAPADSGPLWHAGDTHEHLQSCSGMIVPLSGIAERMEAEDLSLAHVLVWEPVDGTFARFSCQVTGEPDPLSPPGRILQFGVETSGLDCARWGHLIGLGIGAEEADIARASMADGDCMDSTGLGLGCGGGDGTGALNFPVAEHFLRRAGAVTGYAHSVWTLGLYHPSGFAWGAELNALGLATDVIVLDPEHNLAFPNLERLLTQDSAVELHGGLLSAFFPLLGAADAALGEVQFFETTALAATFPLPFAPPANWYGLYYKLLSLGLRVGLAAGSDRVCPLPGLQEFGRTYVLLEEPLSTAAWAKGLSQGRSSVGVPGLRIDLTLAEQRVGGELRLSTPLNDVAARVEIVGSRPLDDTLELVADGVIIASQPAVLVHPGTTILNFQGLSFPASTWVAARLASQRAHTGGIYVIVDGRPIADAALAEYWMVWSDAVVAAEAEHPEVEAFGCQEPIAQRRIAMARRVFESYRGLEVLDPSWEVERFGVANSACRGPLAISTTGPLGTAGSTFVTCVNAPPEANGRLVLSRAALAVPECRAGARWLVDDAAPAALAVHPVTSTRSGYAEVEVPATLYDCDRVYAQFVFVDPPGCAGSGCGGGAAFQSASDALVWRVDGLSSFEDRPR